MNRVERLWHLAQIEAGIERSKLDREPMFGSNRVIEEMIEEVKESSGNQNIAQKLHKISVLIDNTK